MKIRRTFVSNSSSSSFILHFDKPIEEMSYEEFEKIMKFENPIKQIWDELHTDSEVIGNNEYFIRLGSDYQTSEGEKYLYENDLTCLIRSESCH